LHRDLEIGRNRSEVERLANEVAQRDDKLAGMDRMAGGMGMGIGLGSADQPSDDRS
jgi:hypothetical protein